MGVALALEIPASVGVAAAVRVRGPLREGFQLQTATMLGEVPVVRTLMQPGILLLFALKVILEATLTLALTTMEVRYVAVKTDPANAKELNDEVSTTSVTAIVIA